MMPFKTVRDIGEVSGKRIVIRVDFNVPVRDGVVVNDFRIRKTLPLLKRLKERGAHLILISHLSGDRGRSLAPIQAYLESTFPMRLMSLEALQQNTENDDRVILLENIRQDRREAENNPALAKNLADLGDIYINEAFSVSHRKHASIVGVPKLLPAYAGELFSDEYTHLKKLLSPTRPFVLIAAGAKFETKVPLIEAFLEKADTVFVGGALANTFFKARGYAVGASLVSEGSVAAHPVLLDERVLLPEDVEVENDGKVSVVSLDEVGEGDAIFDAGPRTLRTLAERLKGAQTILWNGPLGNYESGFNRRSTELAEMLAKSNAYTVAGGGDTVIAISEAGLEDAFSFISTGGGAMIQFLAKGTLPGIEALER